MCLCIASCTLGTLLSLRAADRAGKGLPLGRALLLSRACVSLSAVLCLLSFLLYWGVFAHPYSCRSGDSLRLGGQGGSVQLGYGFFLSLVSFGVSVTGAMVLWVVRPSAIMKQLQ